MVSTNLFNLTGKVALMTGSSRGMGKAMAEALAEHGARVVISSRKIDQCEATAEEINQRCGADSAVPIACNAGHKQALQALVETAMERLGRIDISIGNAGINPFYGTMSEIPDEAFDKTLATNVKANLWLAQLVTPHMKATGGGSIMVTASTAALRPAEKLGAYCVSKLADVALVRNLALELGPFGIRVNAICPGLVKTEFARALWDTPESEREAREKVPLRRLGMPDDLKGVAVFLASDASAYMTGQALTLCGGTHMWS